MNELVVDFFHKLVKKDEKGCLAALSSFDAPLFFKLKEKDTKNNILYLSFFSLKVFNLILDNTPSLLNEVNNRNENPLFPILRIGKLDLVTLIRCIKLTPNLTQVNDKDEDILTICIKTKKKELAQYLINNGFKISEENLMIINHLNLDIPKHHYPQWVVKQYNDAINPILPIYEKITNSLNNKELPFFIKPSAIKLFYEQILLTDTINYFKLHLAYILKETNINYDLSLSFLQENLKPTYSLSTIDTELLITLINHMKLKNYTDHNIIKLLRTIPDSDTHITNLKRIFTYFDLTEKCKFKNFDDFYDQIYHQINHSLLKLRKNIALNQKINLLNNEVILDNYKIIIPSNSHELAQLGLNLRICVGSYTNNVIEGTSQIGMLVDIRSGKAHYCFNLSPRHAFNIKEIKGFHNSEVPDKVKYELQKRVDSISYQFIPIF